MDNTNMIQTEKSFLKVYPFNNTTLLEQCVEEIKDKLIVNPPIRIYGKNCIQHRSIGFFSNKSIGYYYSGKLAASQNLTPNIQKLLDLINRKFSTEFNGILVNKYLDGNDYIGKHSDDEANLSDIGVVSISFGAIRKFRIRDKLNNRIVLDIPTNPYEIIHMGGDFQKEFTHEIPIEKKIKDVRYSFTFRKHLK
jgi:alkylated DNA repair dioxygenase AlkB